MDELIGLPENESRAASVVASVCGAIVVVVIVATAVTDAVHPLPPIKLKGSESVERAREAAEASVWSGTSAKRIEEDMKIHSRVRAWVGPFVTALRVKMKSPKDRSVIVGEDGWLFYRNRASFPEDRRRATIVALPRLFRALSRRFAAHGSELVAAPIPRKSTLCSEVLPAHIDAAPGFDRELITALEDQNIQTLNLLDPLMELPLEDRYYRQDSHWNEAAVDVFVDRVAALVGPPDGPRKNLYTTDSWEERTGAIVWAAGVVPGHPAVALFPIEYRNRITLEPREAAERLETPQFNERVGLVGTSFARGYDVGQRLSAKLGEIVADMSLSAVPFPLSLQALVLESRQGVLPQFVIVEFPIYQAFIFKTRSGPLSGAYGAIFNLLQPNQLWDLPLSMESSAKLVRGVRTVVIPSRHLLSSGDGVMEIAISVRSSSPTSWSVQSSFREMIFVIPAGGGTVVVPVVEPMELGGYLVMTAVDQAAADADLQLRAVTSCDLDTATDLPWAEDGERVQRASGLDIEVGRFDALLVILDKKRPSIDIELSGVGPNGMPATSRWSTSNGRSKIVLLSMPELEGGRLHAVVVRGATGLERLSIARWRK